MTTTSFNTIPSEGIDFNLTYSVYDQSAAQSSTNTPDYPGLPFQPGMMVFGKNGAKFVFVKAASTITINQAIGIDQTTWQGAPLTKAMADAGRLIGVAANAITSGYYGWIQLSGAVSVTLKNGCLPSVPLYTTASAGMLDDTSGSQTRVYGIRAEVTSTSSGSAKLCWVQGIST